jgi:DNA-binding transcriptional ArsR family regulator
MMDSNAHILLHPLRLRMFVYLEYTPMTAHQLARLLPDAQIRTLYRHLKLLSEAGVIVVHSTRKVRGIEEKTYCVSPDYNVMQTVAHLDKAVFVDQILVSIAEDMKHYLQTSGMNASQTSPDYLFQVEVICATPEEIGRFRELTRQFIQASRHNELTEGRKYYQVVRGFFPLIRAMPEDSDE